MRTPATSALLICVCLGNNYKEKNWKSYLNLYVMLLLCTFLRTALCWFSLTKWRTFIYHPKHFYCNISVEHKVEHVFDDTLNIINEIMNSVTIFDYCFTFHIWYKFFFWVMMMLAIWTVYTSPYFVNRDRLFCHFSNYNYGDKNSLFAHCKNRLKYGNNTLNAIPLCNINFHRDVKLSLWNWKRGILFFLNFNIRLSLLFNCSFSNNRNTFITSYRFVENILFNYINHYIISITNERIMLCYSTLILKENKYMNIPPIHLLTQK